MKIEKEKEKESKEKKKKERKKEKRKEKRRQYVRAISVSVDNFGDKVRAERDDQPIGHHRKDRHAVENALPYADAIAAKCRGPTKNAQRGELLCMHTRCVCVCVWVGVCVCVCVC